MRARILKKKVKIEIAQNVVLKIPRNSPYISRITSTTLYFYSPFLSTNMPVPIPITSK
jgi:hypothetical protein